MLSNQTGQGFRECSGQALRHRSGQAIMELVVALVVVLFLLAAIIQYCSVGVQHTRALSEARHLAAVKAMADTASFEAPLFIQACTEGPDGVAFSRDDGVILDDPAILKEGIVSYAKPAKIDQYKPDNPVSAVGKSEIPEILFGLVQGEQKKTLPLMPIISKLVYQKSDIEVRGSAWLTWTKGIY